MDSEITIGYQTPEGQEYLFGTFAVKKILHESPELIVAQPKNVSFVSLRRYRRTDVKLPFDLKINENQISGFIINLSPSGLLANFNQNLEIKKGQEVHLYIKFLTHPELITLLGEIVRYEVSNNNTTLAINFLNIDEDNRKIIIDYTLHC